MMKSCQSFFSIMINLELSKAQFEVLQKTKKSLQVTKKLTKNFCTFMNLFSEHLIASKNKIMEFLNFISIHS